MSFEGSFQRGTRVTANDAHYWFGFHDLVATGRGGQLVVVRSTSCDVPPIAGDQAEIGLMVPSDTDAEWEWRSVVRTGCFNFPQGNRQQWLWNGEDFLVNQVDRGGSAYTEVWSSRTLKKVDQWKGSTYSVGGINGLSYFVDMGRIHACGGYGFNGVAEQTPGIRLPENNGLWLRDGQDARLIVSLAELMAEQVSVPKSSYPYLTHVQIEPSEGHVAFLLRYRLDDGGEQTILCVCGPQGQGLRQVASGQLSHYCWLTSGEIIVWRRSSGRVDSLRSGRFAASALGKRVLSAARYAKNLVPRKESARSGGRFELVSVQGKNAPASTFAKNVMTQDGHPMAQPKGGGFVVCDTYPIDGKRELYLFCRETGEKVTLGTYPTERKAASDDGIGRYKEIIEPELRVDVPAGVYAFARSGLHCDLHPRWCSSGKFVFIDHLANGTRGVWRVPISPES